MLVRLYFVMILFCLSLFYGCSAMFVPMTRDPEQKVSQASHLIQVGRPLPAERLIREAIDIYKKNEDEKGLSQAYLAYGHFFSSKAVTECSRHYIRNGFDEDTASYEDRFNVSSLFLAKAELIAIKYNDVKVLAGIHQVKARNFKATGKINQACEEYALSLENYRKFLSENHADISWSHKKYRSYDEYILAEMKSLGCNYSK